MAHDRSDLRDRDVTDEALYLRRREFLALGAGSLATLAFPSRGLAAPAGRALTVTKRAEQAGGEKPNSFEDITTYNNFYEFGTDKDDPAKNAGSLRTTPWTISLEGEVKRPRQVSFDELLKMAPLEERIYRMRCVEAWSMVIPWVGVPLASILSQLEPTSNAKYVMFETLYDPKQMPMQKTSILAWPYQEALRMDEAMNPLTMLAVGIYGRVLPNQNGAPVRLVVPWKYGFKGCKSIVKIRLTERQPSTTWALLGPNEYGFYANVNPDVDHPRWSQGKERRIGEFFKRKTLPFNGYADQVAKLYAGLDPKKLF